MEMKFDVVYEVTERESWKKSEDNLAIKSNIAGDEMIECDIAKSLVTYLKKESAMLQPDKLLLGFAEAQKRGLEENLENIDDMALRAKNSAGKIKEALYQSYDEAEKQYEELENKFSETRKRFEDKINATRTAIEADMKSIEAMSKKLSEINNFELSRLADALQKILALVEQDKELVKLVLSKKHKEDEKREEENE
jgi:FAD/FMN-containing dehydrogenase